MVFVMILLVLNLGSINSIFAGCEPSTDEIIPPIFFTTSQGYLPTDVSPESIIQSAPSITEFATSFTSAREGVKLSIIDSIICVATIIGFRASFAFLTKIF